MARRYLTSRDFVYNKFSHAYQLMKHLFVETIQKGDARLEAGLSVVPELLEIWPSLRQPVVTQDRLFLF